MESVHSGKAHVTVYMFKKNVIMQRETAQEKDNYQLNNH